jgi:hypothetical protein
MHYFFRTLPIFILLACAVSPAAERCLFSRVADRVRDMVWPRYPSSDEIAELIGGLATVRIVQLAWRWPKLKVLALENSGALPTAEREVFLMRALREQDDFVRMLSITSPP